MSADLIPKSNSEPLRIPLTFLGRMITSVSVFRRMTKPLRLSSGIACLTMLSLSLRLLHPTLPTNPMKPQKSYAMGIAVLLLLAFLALRTVADPTSIPGLVSWWPANGDANDHAGSNNGTLSGGAYYSTVSGSAFNFDGQQDYMEAPTDSLPVDDQDRTMSCWFRIEEFQPEVESMLVGYGRFGKEQQAFVIGMVADGRVYVSQWGDAVFGRAVEPGLWYHLAGTVENSNVHLFLNGVEVASKRMQLKTTQGQSLVAGRVPGPLGNIRRTHGQVDDIAIFDRALSPEELGALFADGSKEHCDSPRVLDPVQSILVAVGEPFNLSPRVSRCPGMVFQWMKDGKKLDLESNATLSRDSATTEDAGSYALMLTDDLGTITSPVASVEVIPIRITRQPINLSLLVADQATLEVDGCCSASTLQFQWFRNDLPMAGATNRLLILPAVTFSDSGDYSVVVANSLGSTTSKVVQLVVGLEESLGLALGVPELEWTTSGNALWFPTTSVGGHASNRTAQSGDISDEETSEMSGSFTGPGIVTYWWKVSSEQDYDFLSIALDDAPPIHSISGEVEWSQVTIPISDGVHKLSWWFAKDEAVSTGSDAGWVSEVRFVGSPVLSGTALRPNRIQLSFQPTSGIPYHLESSPEISGPWSQVNAPFIGSHERWSTVIEGEGVSKVFYRIVLDL
ncbi:MAG: hypothetical protein JNN07_07760 [Verrucomicrobiales bacterium]|nr:hypothetical protein [Verrucomicrobiales bacterium]